jgi:hypothetical protein
MIAKNVAKKLKLQEAQGLLKCLRYSTLSSKDLHSIILPWKDKKLMIKFNSLTF